MLQMTPQKRIIEGHKKQLHTKKLKNLEEIDKFLVTFSLPQLIHEEIENLNRMIRRLKQ